MSIKIGEEYTTLHAAVLVMLADTLGAHQIGGFKSGVGFALRNCRTCMATKETMKDKVHWVRMCRSSR